MMIEVRHGPKDVVSNAEFYEKQLVEVNRKKGEKDSVVLIFVLLLIY